MSSSSPPAEGGYYGQNAMMYPPQPPPPPVGGTIVEAEVVQPSDQGTPQRCNYTRGELAAMLERCGYGTNEAMYAAFFQRDSSGRHLCASCGLATGFHENDASPIRTGRPSVPPVATQQRRQSRPTVVVRSSGNVMPAIAPAATEPRDIRKPNRTLLEHGILADAIPFPAHWRGGAWFARLLRFDGFEEADAVRMADNDFVRVPMRWRCTAPTGDGGHGQCGALFVTKGAVIHKEFRRPISDAVASLEPAADDGDDDHRPIADHFRDAHNIAHTAPASANAWSTGLGECCAEPAVACSFLLCPCGVPCGSDDGRGQSFCEALDRAAPSGRQNQLFVRQFNHDGTHCAFCNMAVSAFLTLLFTPFLAVAGIISVLTCCGEPCDGPPWVCGPCYARRRNLVKAIGAEASESTTQTRWITVCCCPCSECQQWRELRNSGVWPGLLCCEASEGDREVMSAAAVQARYGLDDRGGVHAVSSDEPCPALEVVGRLPFPKVAWSVQ